MFYDRFGQSIGMIQESDQQVDDFEHIKIIANELYKEWSKFSYGIPVKGEIKDMPGEYLDKHYKFLSPEDVEKYGGGICWDFVSWGTKFLSDKDVNVRTFYIWTETPPNWTTHTFLVIDCGDMNRYVYIESSFDLLKGVWIHNSIDEIIDTITWNMFKNADNQRRFDKFRYVVFEYTGSHPEYGCTSKQYMQWMADHAKVIKEGYAEKNKPPAGVVQEGLWYYNTDLDEIIQQYVPYHKKINGKKFFEIDELIIPLIRLCNKKGYKTRYCCAGHQQHHTLAIDNTYSDHDHYDLPYIMFDKPFMFTNLPSMWELEDPDVNKDDPYVILRFCRYPAKYFSRESKASSNMGWYKEIVNGIQELCKYFEKLPDASEMKQYDVHVQEAKLSTDDRNDLDDSQFGIPELRKYPLTDEKHVLQAVRFLNKAPDEYKEELAQNIVKRAKELDMEWENWDSLKPYLPKTTQESSFMSDYAADTNGITNARLIAARIHDQYKKDSKKPTGNQNCLICTWCAEENFRGGVSSPRPVYSPRDSIFDINGWDIVIKPNKTPIKNKEDVIKKLTVSGDGARYYTHVHWKGGSGGHEFLLLNIDNKIYVMDAQQGLVESIHSKSGSEYFDDADYSDSFICRLDNKQFNQELFDSNNDRSKVLPWNEKLDIPFMRENGMLGEDEEFDQDLMTESYTMEGAWQDIRNGVNPWSKKLYFHVTDNKNLDKKPLKPRIPTWVKNLEDPEKTMKETGRWENITTPRVCVSTSIEGALNSIMNIYKLTDKKFGSQQLYVFTPEKPINQYKHKTNKELIRDGEVFDAETTKEAWILEPVKMKFYGTIQVDRVSDNGNSYPVLMPGGKKNKDDKIGKYTYKWHWLIHPSVQKKMDQYEAENAEEEAKKNQQTKDKPIKEGYAVPESYRSIQAFLEGNYDAFNESD